MTSKTNKERQENVQPLSAEDMKMYAHYVMTGKLESEKDRKKLERISQKPATLRDVTLLSRYIQSMQKELNIQLIDWFSIQKKVLHKMGATDEMFQEAEAEYNADIEETRKQMEQAHKEKGKSEEDKTE
jgi:hypothetical protein